MHNSYKTVKISEEHYNELSRLGEVRDTFDVVIGKLLEARKIVSNGGHSGK
jgi:predicted CopG family antitoxin